MATKLAQGVPRPVSDIPVISPTNAGFTHDTPDEAWIDPQPATAWWVPPQSQGRLPSVLYALV